MAQHLTRHGVAATAANAEAQDGDVAKALRDTAERSGADMIIMGGYVHSRLRELVFGGVTQSLLRQSPVPLFMSHLGQGRRARCISKRPVRRPGACFQGCLQLPTSVCCTLETAPAHL
jgi:hypothetical protein